MNNKEFEQYLSQQKLVVGTHNGLHHVDEATSLAGFRRLHENVQIVRTRDPGKLAECDWVVDVLAKYDFAKRILDHHQKGGAGERENGVPYSSAGLVWKHFGTDIVTAVLGGMDQYVPQTAKMVDERLIQPIDAGDCGVDLVTDRTPVFEGEYGPILGSSYSGAISSINGSWHETLGLPFPDKAKAADKAFEEAVKLAGFFLDRTIIRSYGTLKAEIVVRGAIEKMEEQIIQLEEFCPWQTIVVEESPEALYVVFPAETGDIHMVQCVPKELGSFETRKPLPAPWAGVRDKALQEITGVPDAVFGHNNLFIGGAVSKEGALALARQAVATK